MTTSFNSPWFLLVIAGLLEICWSIGLKYSAGFSKPVPSVFTISSMIVSMYLLSKAAVQLPIGTAYAVWVGIGAAGAAILGVILFKEPLSFLRAVFFVLLIVSFIGLKLTQS